MEGREHSSQRALIGRADDVASLVELVRGGVRILTVCGAPGVGKSRVVRELRTVIGSSSVDADIVWCDMRLASSVSALCAEVSRAIGSGPARPNSDEAAEVDRLGVALRQQSATTIVLDGFDRLVDQGADVIACWVKNADTVSFVVTSRERLRLVDEQVIELEPLSVAAATELFDERARMVRRDWDGDTHRELVGHIVQRIDRLPLAIELAAARMDLMGPADVLAAIEQRIDVLATAERDAPVHHASLIAAIYTSWEGLSPRERAVLAQVSIFRGSFSLQAARAVVDIGGSPPLLEVLYSLRRKSLLLSSISANRGGRARFSLYETIRRFANERLVDQQAGDSTAERHALYFAGEAAGNSCWNDDDLLDIVAVAENAIEDDIGLALRATFQAEPLLWRSGRASQVGDMLSRVLSSPTAEYLEPGHRARALELRGRTRRLSGALSASLADLERALKLWTKLENASGRGRALYELATLSIVQGDLVSARDLYQASLEAHRDGGELVGEAAALDGLAGVIYQLGEGVARARSTTTEALRVARAAGDRNKEAICRGHLGLFALELGMLDEAELQLELALEIHREHGHVRFEASELNNLALTWQEKGELERSLEAFETSLALQRRTGDARAIGISLIDLGACREEGGHLAAAVAAYAEAIQLLRLIEDHWMIARALAFQGRVAARQGRGEEARLAFRESAAMLAERENSEVATILKICRAHFDGALPELPEEPAQSCAIRAALRVLSRMQAGADDRALTLDRAAHTFRIGAASPISLLIRPTLWRVLECLAVQCVSAPGVALDRDTLFAHGWPDEKISSKSAAGRVRSAVYALRKLGLGELLASSNEGYLLSPDVAVVLS